jgi:hypothetical protein
LAVTLPVVEVVELVALEIEEILIVQVTVVPA